MSDFLAQKVVEQSSRIGALEMEVETLQVEIADLNDLPIPVMEGREVPVDQVPGFERSQDADGREFLRYVPGPVEFWIGKDWLPGCPKCSHGTPVHQHFKEGHWARCPRCGCKFEWMVLLDHPLSQATYFAFGGGS